MRDSSDEFAGSFGNCLVAVDNRDCLRMNWGKLGSTLGRLYRLACISSVDLDWPV